MFCDPIAIVGIGLRLPGGACDVESFWDILKKGKDCMIDIPEDRWDKERYFDPTQKRLGTSKAAQGGFLEQDPKLFDSLFFNISPREAEVLDPQQRWLLECTWEAFEDAGMVLPEIRGSRGGVFIGGFSMDNLLLQLGVLNREKMNSHTATSSTLVMLLNRTSYTFDMRGPSMTLDTACSSSLVSTHMACQSIWSGESDWAFTGGADLPPKLVRTEMRVS